MLAACVAFGIEGWPADAALVSPGACGREEFILALACLPGDARAGFIEIPSGPFTMGSDSNRDGAIDEDEPGPHIVNLPAYYIARYETTVAQFRLYLRTTGRKLPVADEPTWALDEPVRRVSWDDASAYARWVQDRLRRSANLAGLVDQGWVVSLPSEAEWEKAARGSHAVRGRTAWTYPWGDGIDRTRANYSVDGSWGRPLPVGSFPSGRSPYGLDDMSGNVWEWTRTIYEIPPRFRTGRARRSPEGPPRVVRGGGHGERPQTVRIGVRHGFLPATRWPNLGFRLVLVRRQ